MNAERGDCPLCMQSWPLSVLEQHVQQCLDDSTARAPLWPVPSLSFTGSRTNPVTFSQDNDVSEGYDLTAPPSPKRQRVSDTSSGSEELPPILPPLPSAARAQPRFIDDAPVPPLLSSTRASSNTPIMIDDPSMPRLSADPRSGPVAPLEHPDISATNRFAEPTIIDNEGESDSPDIPLLPSTLPRDSTSNCNSKTAPVCIYELSPSPELPTVSQSPALRKTISTTLQAAPTPASSLFAQTIQRITDALKGMKPTNNGSADSAVHTNYIQQLLSSLSSYHTGECDELHSYYLQEQELIRSHYESRLRQQADEFSVVRISLEQATALLSKEQNEKLELLRTEELLKREEAQEQAERVRKQQQREFEAEKKRLEQEKEEQLTKYRELSLSMQKNIDSSAAAGDRLPEEELAVASSTRQMVTLKPSMQFDESKKLQDFHFRLVESQFLRLTAGQGYRVDTVEYHINPALLARYNAFKEQARYKSRDGTIKETLVFHGSSDEGIKGILDKGFIIGGTNGVAIASGASLGNGVYTSQSPSFAMNYIKSGGARRLLFARVCMSDDAVISPSGATIDNNHPSSCIQQLVCKNPAQVLPLYVVHFSSQHDHDHSYPYGRIVPSMPRGYARPSRRAVPPPPSTLYPPLPQLPGALPVLPPYQPSSLTSYFANPPPSNSSYPPPLLPPSAFRFGGALVPPTPVKTRRGRGAKAAASTIANPPL